MKLNYKIRRLPNYEIPQRAPKRARKAERGYVLITILLGFSLMSIAALAVLPSFIFELKRDQEEEMIHRGVQYTRAIRVYYRKLGRYPTRLEDLDNTNNLRYLRKHYKDPLTGQDFKLLHFGDPGLTLGGSFGGGVIPGANPIGSPTGANGSSGSAFGGSSSFGGSSTLGGSSSGFGNSGGLSNSGVNSSGVFSQSSSSFGGSFGGNSNSSFGSSSSPQTGTGQQATGQQAASPSGSDPSQASTQVAANGAQGDTSSSSQQVFGGGPIVGVASLCKKTTIREFNHKKKYNEWQFIYDPTADRGGLIKTPYQPVLQGFGSPQNVNAQSGSGSGSSSGSFGGSSIGGSSGSSFGNSFGQPNGMGNSPFGQTPPAQPPSTSPQQQ
ncbi:MAG TPA: type II secretion system protein [Candidatus Eremiobacteraceae bacterium]|nr:type II secretion system protein [Candidatus Eremiobacteraceae bacterium]